MVYLAIVTALALLQFFWFGILVGKARIKYKVEAPAMSGDPMFERAFRVQMNTLEQLVMLLPSLWIFGAYVSAPWAAGLGAVYLIGRFIYNRSYVREPKSRGVGFALSSLPSMIMIIGILVWAVRQLLAAQ